MQRYEKEKDFVLFIKILSEKTIACKLFEYFEEFCYFYKLKFDVLPPPYGDMGLKGDICMEEKVKKKRGLSRFFDWYFGRRALPYWGVLIMDCSIVLFSLFLAHIMNNGFAEFSESFLYLFGFVRKDTDDLIGCGSIGPHNGDRERWGFGYNLRKDQWGNGYATEAAKAMLQYAFDEKKLHRVIATCQPQNPPSYRVMSMTCMNMPRYRGLAYGQAGYLTRIEKKVRILLKALSNIRRFWQLNAREK